MAQRVPEYKVGRIYTIYTARVIVRYFFGSWVRLMHWLRAFLYVWLPVSGFYLAYPYLARSLESDTAHTFIMAQIRGLHILGGWILAVTLFVRLYHFIFLRPDGRFGFSDEFMKLRVIFDLKAWKENLQFYLLMWKGVHPPTYNLKYYYGPLQAASYLAFYTMLFGLIVTGILLAAPYQSEGFVGFVARFFMPLQVALGGLAGVRTLHLWLVWATLIFAVVHIYMAVWNSLRTRTLRVESIISGLSVLEGLEEPISEEEYEEAMDRILKQHG